MMKSKLSPFFRMCGKEAVKDVQTLTFLQNVWKRSCERRANCHLSSECVEKKL